jgi:3-oxoacyl-[acyl-carrier protein] reductase
MGKFDGKVAIVGGNLGKEKKGEFVLGLGGEIAKKLVAEGAQVVVVDLSFADAQACAKSIGGKIKAVDVDLVKDRTFEMKEIETDKGPKKEAVWVENLPLKMTEDIVAEFGKIDAVICNFDYFDKARLDNTTMELYEELLAKNVTPTFHLLAGVREQLANQTKKDGSYAKVVLITSMVGKAGMSLGTVYSAMKGAMIGLNKALAREFGRFANVNTVAIGPLADTKKYQGPKDNIKKGNFMVTSSDMSNINLEPSHIIPMVMLLASDDAMGISGQSISIDGGLWLKLEQ